MEYLNIDRIMQLSNLMDENILAERLARNSGDPTLAQNEDEPKGQIPKEIIGKETFPRPLKRRELQFQRKRLKDEETDKHRSLEHVQAPLDVGALARKLKNKAEVRVEDLKSLKNILLEDEKNINIVLSQEGALRGIVRELTGSDVRRQEQAAGILCNLALARGDTVHLLSKVTGVYLTLTLDSQNDSLAVIAAWTVGNMCGAGPAACRDVEAAGALPAMCRLARRAAASEAAVYALSLYASEMQDLMSVDRLNLILESVAAVRCAGVFRLLFILSCHRDFADRGRVLERAVTDCIEDMLVAHQSCVGADCCELVFCVRALAGLSSGAHFRFLAHLYRVEHRRRLFHSLNEDVRLQASLLWFYGNALRKQRQTQEESQAPGDQVDLQPPHQAAWN